MIFQDFVASQNRPKSTHITRLIQGYETHSFKANFDSWPSGSAPSVAEEGRGKVAGMCSVLNWSHILVTCLLNCEIVLKFCVALLKQQGGVLKGTGKTAPVNEEVPPLLEGGGKTEV